jgi:putative colanic acid biosysnthesis UDP-glucose lipid carrier transferase
MAKLDNRYTLIRYVIDAPIIGIGYLLSAKATLGQEHPDNSVSDFLLTGLALLVWYLAASFSRLYTDRRSNKYSEEIIFIIYTLIIYTVLLSSVFFFLRNYVRFNAGFFGFFLGFLFIFLSLTKYIVRKYLHAAIYKGKLFDNLLIIGTTPAAYDFYETINKYYYYGYKCIGFLDDQQQKMNGCNYFGKVNVLFNILQQQKVDEVIIALHNNQNKQIQECIEVCDYFKVKARILPDTQLYSTSSTQFNNIGQLSVINIRALPLDKLENKILKQSFDILFSLLFFILIGSWLMPLIALAIKLSSKGPVIFKQERWGLNNEKIICYKFRTMVAESEDIGPNGEFNQATPNDPRVTRLGMFLRKSNLDELPQFWNVLLGNMSTVGPRPHPTPLNIQVMHTVDNYMLRHIVKPGISGWAQVNGCRGETREPGSMQRRVNFDLYYIHRWTFWLDCQIILQTIINIFRGDQSAY